MPIWASVYCAQFRRQDSGALCWPGIPIRSGLPGELLLLRASIIAI